MTAPCAVGPVSSLPCLTPQALRQPSIQTVLDVVSLHAMSPSCVDVGTASVQSGNAAGPKRNRVPANLYRLPRVQVVNST
jgi:hypothetical protein